MKQLFLTTVLFSFLFVGSLAAQVSQETDPVVEQKEPQKLRFGLKGFSSIGWLSPENEMSLTRGKAGLGFGWGLNMEFYINKTTSFRTGFSLSTYSSGIYYNDDEKNSSPETYNDTYYVVDGGEFQKWESDSTIPFGELRKLTTRKYKLSYVNIPLLLKLKTKEIGYMTYYGEFGGIIGVNTKSKVEDQYLEVEATTNIDGEITGMNKPDSEEKLTTNDYVFDDVTQLLRAGLCLGAGAEYNFSGSTSLFFQINWNYFMTNMMKKEEKDNYLRSFNSNTEKFETVNSKSIPGSFHLTVGILF